MKRLAFVVCILITVFPAVWATIAVQPAAPVPGQQVTFTYQPKPTEVPVFIDWDLGDGSVVQRGTGNQISHVYTHAGTFTVRAGVAHRSSGDIGLVITNDFVTVTVSERRQISFAPAQPAPGQAVSLQAQNFYSTCIAWDFGDGTRLDRGQRQATHTYAQPGTYLVRAIEDCGRNPAYAAQVRVVVRIGTGPTATFSLTQVMLRWQDGTTTTRVARDFTPLIAYADLKFEGSGALQVQWLVDERPFATQAIPLDFAATRTIDSGRTPAIPTNEPGRHRVRLVILNRGIALNVPAIEYNVGMETAGAVPQVDAAAPDHFSRDKEYSLKLTGRNLVAGTRFDFGNDVAVVGSPRILSSTEAEVGVFVSRAAKDGERQVGAENSGGRSRGPGRVRIGQLKIVPGASRIKFDCPDLQNFKKGSIGIKTPLNAWGDDNVEMATIDVSPIDDGTVFEWQETNPGAATGIEVRFYDKAGKHILLRKRLSAGAKSYAGGDGLLHELFALVGAGYQPQKSSLTGFDPGKGKRGGYVRSHADLQWQVVGLRSFNCPEALLSQELRGQSGWPKEVEVSASDMRPLFLPERWTGLDCPAGGYQQLKVNVVNLDREKLPNGNVDNSNYVGQNWELSGDFDLTYSPLSLDATPVWQKPTAEQIADMKKKNMIPTSTFTQIDFANVFVDWGDGSPVEPVAGRFEGGNGSAFYPVGSESGYKTPKTRYLINTMHHAFPRTGIHTVRVFQLPRGGLFQPLAAGNGWNTSAEAELAANTQLGQEINPGKTYPSGLKPLSGLPQTVAEAYQVYCYQVPITSRMDHCANGPLNLTSLQITGFPGFKAPAGAPVTATTCDEMFTAQADIKYFGRGSLEVTWKVARDDKSVDIGTDTYHGLSSPNRGDLDKKASWDCSNPPLGTLTVTSPPLPVEKVGAYRVTAVARVMIDPAEANLDHILEAVELVTGGHQGGQGNPLYCAWIRAYVDTFKQNSKGGLFSGLLGAIFEDYYHKNCGSDSVSTETPPLRVSGSAPYGIKEADPKKLCNLLFPTRDGIFRITGVQEGVTKQNGRYSGKGVMKLPFTSSSDGNRFYPVPITIRNWQVDETSGMVLDGAIDEAPATSLAQTPGVDARLEKLRGRVQNKVTQDLTAALDLGFRDQGLRRPGSPEKPPVWKGLGAKLSAEGDWIKSDSLPEILLGWSSFRLSSSKVTFDYSKVEGKPAQGPCSTASPSWVGVDLGQATLVPFTFDLAAKGGYGISAAGFVVVDDGLCGKASGGPFTSDLKRGSVSFAGLDFSAAKGEYDVLYKGMDIHIPWPDTHLQGDARLAKSAYGYGIDFKGVNSPVKTMNYGQFTQTARKLRFTTEKNIGWVVESETQFDLRAEGKPFAGFTVDRFLYGFDGRPYFPEGALTQTVPLSGHSTLGDTSLDLLDCVLTSQQPGPMAMSLAVHTKTYLSENPIVPASAVQVNYEVLDTVPAFTGRGPFNSPFTTPVAFPLGNPSIQADWHPVYTPGSGGSGGGDPGHSGPFAPPPTASFQGTRFYGDVELAMFGGAPLRTQLLIGYQGGHSYFLTRGDIPLGPSGIPLSPLPFCIFRMSGGLGYNFPVNSFKDQTIENAQPDMSGSTLFMAGMRLGSSDGFAFTLDGTMTVKTSGQARMDFDSWLLTGDHSGNGQFQGMLQYGGGSFDGRLWGGLDLLAGLIKFDLGSSEANSAIDLHFDDGGNWHFYAGKRDGPRIRAVVLGTGSDSYLMLGNKEGLAVGGGQNIHLGVGDSSVASASIDGWMDIGLQVAPGPRVAGDFTAGVEASVCALGACVGAGVDADVHAEAPPLSIRASASVDLPWPLPSVSFSVHL